MVRHQKCGVTTLSATQCERFGKPRCTLRNGIPSESFQPVENRGIRAPRCRPSSEIGRPCLLDRLSFHLQINGGIAIRSCHTGMAQTLTDSCDLHACAKQMDSGTVAYAVRVQPFAAQRRLRNFGTCAVFSKQVPHTEPREALTAVITEQRSIG